MRAFGISTFYSSVQRDLQTDSNEGGLSHALDSAGDGAAEVSVALVRVKVRGRRFIFPGNQGQHFKGRTDVREQGHKNDLLAAEVRSKGLGKDLVLNMYNLFHKPE